MFLSSTYEPGKGQETNFFTKFCPHFTRNTKKRLFNKIQFFHQNQQLGTYIYSFYGQFCFDIFFSSCEQAVYCTIFNCLQPLCHIVRTQQEHKMQVTLMGKNKCRKKKSISFSRTRYCPKCSVSGHIETIRSTSPEVNMGDKTVLTSRSRGCFC